MSDDKINSSIAKPSEASTNQKGASRQDYDMVDTDEDLRKYPPLCDALATCRDAIMNVYDPSDKSALRNQRRHRLTTIIAAACGTAAVLSAIIYLSGLSPTPWPIWIEVSAMVVASLAVVLGLIQALQTNWLVQRHKAERCRLLKFRFLIDPDLWCNEPSKKTQLETQLHKEVKEINNLTKQSLPNWIKKLDVTEGASAVKRIENCEVPKGTLQALVDYYGDKRINEQKRYFDNRARRNEGFNKYTRHLHSVLFFLSALAVLIHFSMDIFFKAGNGIHPFSVLLVVVAASLPVVGAGIRTYRSAYEFARSASLFRARHQALERLSNWLDEEIAEKDPSEKEILLALWHCEQLLETEHREWLRLMTEVEWFG